VAGDGDDDGGDDIVEFKIGISRAKLHHLPTEAPYHLTDTAQINRRCRHTCTQFPEEPAKALTTCRPWEDGPNC
jgi:hypothetical protein